MCSTVLNAMAQFMHDRQSTLNVVAHRLSDDRKVFQLILSSKSRLQYLTPDWFHCSNHLEFLSTLEEKVNSQNQYEKLCLPISTFILLEV